jgi:hypothetical protein
MRFVFLKLYVVYLSHIFNIQVACYLFYNKTIAGEDIWIPFFCVMHNKALNLSMVYSRSLRKLLAGRM